MLTKGRLWELGWGYVYSNQIHATTDTDADDVDVDVDVDVDADADADADTDTDTDTDGNVPYQLVYPKYDTPQTLPLAEDLIFLHALLSHPHRSHDGKCMNTSNCTRSDVWSLQLFVKNLIFTVVP